MESDLFRDLVSLAVLAGQHGVGFIIPDEGFGFTVELEMTADDVFGLV